MDKLNETAFEMPSQRTGSGNYGWAAEARKAWQDMHRSERDQIEKTAAEFRAAGVDKIAVAKWEADQIAKANAEAAEKSKQSYLDAFQSIMGGVSQTFSAWTDLQANQSQIAINQLQRELDQMKKNHEKELAFKEAMGYSEEELQNIRDEQKKQEAAEQEKLDKKKAQIEKQAFDREKQAKIAQATMSGAVAFVEALPSLWKAAVVAASTVAQIALISQQKYPGLAEGGIVPAQGMSGGLYRLGDRNKSETVLPYDIRKVQTGGGTVVFNGDVNLYGVGGKDEFVRDLQRAWQRQQRRGVTVS